MTTATSETEQTAISLQADRWTRLPGTYMEAWLRPSVQRSLVVRRTWRKVTPGVSDLLNGWELPETCYVRQVRTPRNPLGALPKGTLPTERVGLFTMEW